MKIILIALLFCIVGNLYSQEKSLGLYTGLVYYQPDKNLESTSDIGGMIGIRAEYSPKKAVFSLVSGLQYLTVSNYLQVPMALNFRMGNTFRFKILGGIVPTIRLNTEAPDKSFVIGGQLGIGFEYRISSKFIIFTDFAYYVVPGLTYAPSHSGNEDVVRESESFAIAGIGVKYLLNRIYK